MSLRFLLGGGFWLSLAGGADTSSCFLFKVGEVGGVETSGRFLFWACEVGAVETSVCFLCWACGAAAFGVMGRWLGSVVVWGCVVVAGMGAVEVWG